MQSALPVGVIAQYPTAHSYSLYQTHDTRPFRRSMHKCISNTRERRFTDFDALLGNNSQRYITAENIKEVPHHVECPIK